MLALQLKLCFFVYPRSTVVTGVIVVLRISSGSYLPTGFASLQRSLFMTLYATPLSQKYTTTQTHTVLCSVQLASDVLPKEPWVDLNNDFLAAHLGSANNGMYGIVLLSAG